MLPSASRSCYKHLANAVKLTVPLASIDYSLLQLVSPLTNQVLIASKSVTKSLASGDKTCPDFYSVQCYTEDEASGNKTFGVDINYENCNTGLIGCDKKGGFCPLFFQENASQEQEETVG